METLPNCDMRSCMQPHSVKAKGLNDGTWTMWSSTSPPVAIDMDVATSGSKPDTLGTKKHDTSPKADLYPKHVARLDMRCTAAAMTNRKNTGSSPAFCLVLHPRRPWPAERKPRQSKAGWSPAAPLAGKEVPAAQNDDGCPCLVLLKHTSPKKSLKPSATSQACKTMEMGYCQATKKRRQRR